jgi:hypothetical protein
MVSVADHLPAQVPSQHSQHRRYTCLVSEALHPIRLQGDAAPGVSCVLNTKPWPGLGLMICPWLDSAGQISRQA